MEKDEFVARLLVIQRQVYDLASQISLLVHDVLDTEHEDDVD